MLSAIAETLTGMGAAERSAEGGARPPTDTATSTSMVDGDPEAPDPSQRTEGKDEAAQTSGALLTPTPPTTTSTAATAATAAVVCDRDRSDTAVPAKSHRSTACKPHALPLDTHRKERKPGSAPEAHYLHHEEPRNLPGYPVPGLAQPESAGAAAALLAHASAKPVATWQPNPNSAAGAAASLAHASREAGGSRLSPRPEKMAPDGSAGDWPLRGALGAVRGGRRRTGSSSATYSGAGGAVFGAATAAHATAKMRRNSGFGATLDSETAAGKHKADIRNAVAVSTANERMKREEVPDVPPSSRPTRRAPFPNLEEAARRQAEERLAKIGYLAPTPGRRASPSSASRVMASDRDRGRALDQESERADKQKRGHDALVLMNAAKKNVQARLSLQDQQIAERKGIVCSDEWTSRATEIAQRKLEQPKRHPAQVDIGGGAYMDQAEIDRIAERNVRPVIEAIDERAGGHRRLQQEKKEAKAQDRARRMSRFGDAKIFGGSQRHRDRNAVPEARRTYFAHQSSSEHDRSGDMTAAADHAIQAVPMPPVPEKTSTLDSFRARIRRKTRGDKEKNRSGSDPEYARPSTAPTPHVEAGDSRRELTTAGSSRIADRTGTTTLGSESARPSTAPETGLEHTEPSVTPTSALPATSTQEAEEERRRATPPRSAKEPANELWVARLFGKRSNANPEPVTEPDAPSAEPTPKFEQTHKRRGSIGNAFFDRIRASKGAEQMEIPGLEKRETERLFVDRSTATGPTQAPATMAAGGIAAASPACILPPEPATDPDDAADSADSHEAYADAPSTPAAPVHSEVIAQSVTETTVTEETVAVPLGSDATVEAVPLFQSTTVETSTVVKDAEGNTLHRAKSNPVVLNAEISSIVEVDGEASGMRESRFREEL